jgi:hypothetical protein
MNTLENIEKGLNQVRAGESVAYHNGSTWTAVMVTRVTKACIEINGTLFNKASGLPRGADSAWNRQVIQALTPKTERLIARDATLRRHEALVNVLRNFSWNTLSADELQRIYDAARAAAPKDAPTEAKP